MSIINEDLKSLRLMFQARGFDIRLVGGAVRDILRSTQPKDIDLCTDATPDEQKEIYDANNLKSIPTGVDHGTWSVVMNGETYEITSLRTESEHDGRYAKMTFTRDWVEDLSRRDLTVNAMAMGFDGELIDPFNGVKDLIDGTVRFVGDAGHRMREDYLRILRYFRFLGRVGRPSLIGSYVVAPEVKSALLDNIQGLEKISVERIWSETKKILEHSTGPAIYHTMYAHGVCHHTPLPLMTDLRSPAEMLRVHKFTSNPVTVLCATMSISEADTTLRALKASREERDLARVVCKYRDKTVDELYYAIYVDGVDPEMIAEVARYQGLTFVANLLESTPIPKFPVSGEDLMKAGMEMGPEIGATIRRMKDTWFKSGCRMGKYELLEKLPTL